MIVMSGHGTATCPDCGSQLMYGVKSEATSYKVYYECGDRCGWERMPGRIPRSDIDHQDEIDERAEEMGKRWA